MSPYMPSVASGTKPIVFGDFNYYWLIERGGVALKAMHERYAELGLVGFFGAEYIDGKLIDRTAAKALLVG